MGKIKNNILLIYIILIAVFLGIVIALVSTWYITHKNDVRIQGGVFIKGVNVSGLTKEEAKIAVQKYLDEVMSEYVVFEYRNYDYNVEVSQINAYFDIDSAVEYAYNIGRKRNFFADVVEYASVLMNKIDIEPILKYDEKALDDYIDFLQVSLPDQVEQGSYYIDNNELVITSGKNGAGIYRDRLKEIVLESLQDVSYSYGVLEIPTYITYPDKMNVDLIHNDIYREMNNAYYTSNPYAIYVEQTGVDFDLEQAKFLVENGKSNEEYRIPLNYTYPEITVAELGLDAFPNRLSTFSTNYVNNPNRTTNLKLASNKINGTVVMPGETFSFNQVVGKRTRDAGYKDAAIFSDGMVTDGLGGGICQITSTLYDAVIFADLEIVYRRNHMFIPSYVDGGEDATVVWGSTDFKFKNSRDYPIKILSSVEGGIATVSIYGLATDNEYDISIETKTIKSIPYSTEYRRNTGHKSGTVIQSGAKGYVIDSYKVYKQNGVIVKKEKLSRDTYSAQARIIAR